MNFDKNDISFEGNSKEVWVIYKAAEGKNRRFIARFKHMSPKRCANHFVKFLIKNFFVAEYFDLIENGETPLGALKTKGYVSYHEEKLAA